MQNLQFQHDLFAQPTSDQRDAERAHIGGRYMMRVDPCDGRIPVMCKVVDYSVTGVRLELPQGIDLPSDIHVLIGNVAHEAKIVWRGDGEIGVDFVNEHHDII
jgi:PilZ domain